MDYDFARHCYLLGENQFKEEIRAHDNAYAERCHNRSITCFGVANFLGYTDEVHSQVEFWLNESGYFDNDDNDEY